MIRTDRVWDDDDSDGSGDDPDATSSDPDADGSLDDAVAEQHHRYRHGEPFDLSTLLVRYPVLRDSIEAQATLAYVEYRLDESITDITQRQRFFLSKYSHLTSPLQSQFDFAELIESPAIDFGDDPIILPDAPTLTDPSGSRHSEAAEVPSDGSPSDVRGFSGSGSPAESSGHGGMPPPGGGSAAGGDPEPQRPPAIGFGIAGVPDQLGKFRLEALVGEGGMGWVFRARDVVLDRDVALKISRQRRATRGLRQQLLREARLACRVHHPNLAEVYEADFWGSDLYIVSRWADGGSLLEYLDLVGGPIEESRVVWLMSQVVQGLEACHRHGITHLDLKPANILFDRDRSDADVDLHGFPGRPVITDFGIAKLHDLRRSGCTSRSVAGTPLYMAPEQIMGDAGDVGPATDVFACGLLMRQLLMGRHPLEGEPIGVVLSRLRTDVGNIPDDLAVSDPLRKIIRCCGRTSATDRYASAAHLRDDLTRLADNQPVRPVRVCPLDVTRRWLERSRRIEDAATLNIALNTSIFLSFVIGIIAIFLGSVPELTARRWEVVTDTVRLSVFPHLPMVMIGVATLRWERRLHLFNVGLSAVFLILVVSTLITGHSPLRFYRDHPFAHRLVHDIILGLAIFLFGANLAAMPAWWRVWRRGDGKPRDAQPWD